MPPVEHTGTALGIPVLARDLLSAFLTIGSDLDLHSVLERVVGTACELTGARYGAIGITGTDGEMSEFVTAGMSRQVHELIGDLPRGRGLLGELMDHPEPLRLARLQDHESSVGFPAGHPPMSSLLGVPLRIRGTVFGNLYLTEKAAGRPFTAQDELVVQALATAAGFVVDNARAYALSERRRQWLEASVRIGESLQPPILLGAALQQVVIATRRVTGAAAVAIVQRDDAGEYRTAAVDDTADDRTQDIVTRLGEQIRQCDTTADQEVLAEDAEGTVALVPLKGHLALSGVLVVILDEGRGSLAGEDRELLAVFADQASLALDRAQAVEDQGRLAVVSDRDRIARDLHDVVIQQLFATGLHLQGARRLSDPEAVTARIDAAVRDLDDTIRDIRTTIFALQGERSHSLRAEALDLTQEYVVLLGFAPTVRSVGPVDTAVPPDLGTHLVAVLRELVSNVARHAVATRCAVDIRVAGGNLALRVLDDGVGYPDQRHESGLRNVRRRAHELGGTVRLTSTVPHGTTVEWLVPLAGPASLSPLNRSAG